MMKRRNKEGVALVVTLILLAVITIVVVAFLAVSQRNRQLTTTATDQANAQLMAKAGLERAQAEVAARLMVRSNLAPVQMLVSTNYVRYQGFVTGIADPANASYTYARLDNPVENRIKPGYAAPIYDPALANAAGALSYSDLMLNLQNLFYNPRPPVFVRTNPSPIYPPEFRFYLDLNRNGRFDPTGPQWNMAVTNGILQPIGRTTLFGDPEWIGVLEHPDRPHAADNRFIGRYAFLVVPEGLTLDLNAMHNFARTYAPAGGPGQLNVPQAAGQDRFSRDEGVGTYELNLAAFLVGLNTNMWFGPNQTGLAGEDYFYNWQNPGGVNTGYAFDDALGLLSYRYRSNPLDGTTANLNSLLPTSTSASANGSYAVLLDSPTNNFGASTFAQTNRIDEYANGPLPLITDFGRTIEDFPSVEVPADEPTSSPWSGSPNPTRFASINDLFDSSKAPLSFVTRLDMVTHSNDTYNSGTLYRLLSQLGTDSGSEPESFEPGLGVDSYTATNFGSAYQPPGLINLNFDNRDRSNDPLAPANLKRPLKSSDLIPWEPLAFFTNSAARMLRSQAFVGSDGRLISLTNILVWPTNNYDGAVHRILQVAANMYDAIDNTNLAYPNAAGSEQFPTVFRPYLRKEVLTDNFGVGHTNLYIAGYTNQVGLVDQFGNVQSPSNFVAKANYWNLNDPNSLNAALAFLPANQPPPVNQPMVLGVPLVVGAKKGYPNFNEIAVETAIQIQRNLQLRRPVIHALPNQTNEFYFLGISNVFGVEAWNSYKAAYPRELTMAVEVDFDMAVLGTNSFGGPSTALVQEWPPTALAAGGWPISTNFAAVMDIGLNTWKGQKFQIPLMTNHIFLSNSVWRPSQYPRFAPAASNVFNYVSLNPNQFLIPDWNLSITNRVRYVVLDTATGHIVDYANLDRMTWSTNVVDAMELQDRAGRDSQGSQFWDMRRLGNNQANTTMPTAGMNQQLMVSLGFATVSDTIWRNYGAQQYSTQDKNLAIDAFRRFATGLPGINFPGRGNPISPDGLVAQAPFSPARNLELTRSYEVNDPLVHYTSYDIAPPPGATDPLPQPAGWASIPVPHLKSIGQINKRYQPWGQGDDPLALNPMFIDPLIASSDDWNFPDHKLPNVGWIGRIHRGTPWQTIYLKSVQSVSYSTNNVRGAPVPGVTVANWYDSQKYTRGKPNEYGLPNYATPDRDWRFLDLFTAAPASSATRGQVSVNQTGEASWSAVLGGVIALTNDTSLASPAGNVSGSRPYVIQPGSTQLRKIVTGINTTRDASPYFGQFRSRGDLLAVPELSISSPYLDQTSKGAIRQAISDAALERIPQEVMSLLRLGEPRVIIYAYGQALKPAPLSINLDPKYLNLVTNYQITGEYATRSIVKFEKVPPLLNDATNQTRLRAVVVESKVLNPD